MIRAIQPIALLWVSTALISAQAPSDLGHSIATDLRAGRYADARKLLEKALKQSPKDARLWSLNGVALESMDDAKGALASFNRALELAPDYVPALEGAAQIEFESDDPRAEVLLKHLSTLKPADPTTHSLLATIAFKHGDCETARNEFAAARFDTGELGVLKEFGACLVGQRRIAEAIPSFRRIADLQPDNPSAQVDIANVEFLAGNYNKVISILDGSSDAEAQDLLAEAYEATLNKEKALAALHRAIDSSPGVPRYYVDLAYLCLAAHDFQEGIDVLNKGIPQVTAAAPLYVARGILLSELDRFEEGARDFQTAEGLDPNVEFVSAAKSLAELQENDLPKAEKTVRDRLRQHPKDAFLHYLLAEVLLKEGAAPGSGEFHEAIDAATAAVSLDPNLGVARDALGELYLESGQTEQAIEQSRIAYRLNPNDETALYHLIVSLKKANRVEGLPELAQQLAALKQRNRAQESMEQRYTSVDQDPAATRSQGKR